MRDIERERERENERVEGERENEREAVMYVRVGNPATRTIDQTDRQIDR